MIDQKFINKVFSASSAKYDLMNDLMSFGLHRFWKNKLVQILKSDISILIYNLSNENTIKILDGATGTCDIPAMLSQEYRNSSILEIECFDINESMIKLGKAKLIDKNILNVVPELGDAQDLKYESEYFDIYTMVFGMRNLPDKDKALKEAFRVLRPGGKFFCMEFGRPSFPVDFAYKFHSNFLIPNLAKYIGKNEASYEYLIDSINKFDSPFDFINKIKSCGFKEVNSIKMMNGLVNLYIATKDELI